MSVSRVFVDACNVKLSDCKDVVDYTSRYQIAFDKLLSLITEESWMSRKSIEMALQGSLLRRLGKSYSALVSAIETTWTDETTDLSDTILLIICHAEINKGNKEDLTENHSKVVLATRTPQAPRGTCTTQGCIDGGSTTHFPDRCWVKHPELRARYSLRQMRTRESNRSLRKAATSAESERKETLAPSEIESWQPRVLAIEDPRENCLLVDSAADVHVYNDLALMIEYRELPTRIGGSTSNGVSPGRGRVRLWLALTDGSEGLILKLWNLYYLPKSPCNLVSLGLLNNSGIFHDNKNETLYQVKPRQTLA